MKGGSLKDVQELLDHATMAMPLRYAHLSQKHKRKAVNLLNGMTAFNIKVDCHILFLFGGAEGARTPDLMTASHALSQLSYSPVEQ
jgi:hypothetical protein